MVEYQRSKETKRVIDEQTGMAPGKTSPACCVSSLVVRKANNRMFSEPIAEEEEAKEEEGEEEAASRATSMASRSWRPVRCANSFSTSLLGISSFHTCNQERELNRIR